jgi:hypothetical protein
MKKLALIAALCAMPLYAAAQSSPGLIPGQTPTAAQWNSYFAAKQDYVGSGPVSGPGSSVVGDEACFNSTSGSLLKDCGVPYTIKASQYASLALADSAAVTANACLGIDQAYSISGNLTLNAPCVTDSGFVLTISNGVTLTFAHPFYAPATSKVFANANGGSAGLIAFSNQEVCHPEWWGAQQGNGVFDDTPYIQASFAACPITQLMMADYYIQSSLVLSTSHRILRGIEPEYTGAGSATRIIFASATGDAILAGLASNPGSVSSYPTEIHLSNFHLTRNTAVTVGGGVGVQAAPAGIRLQYLQHSSVDHIWSIESSQSLVMGALVYSFVDDFVGFRTVSGTNVSNDPYACITYDGSFSVGFAGGNASVYVNRSNCSVGGSPTLTASYGVYTYQGWSDFFITDLETATIQYGMYLQGTSAANTGTQNFHAIRPILDSASISALYITGGGQFSTVNVIDGYFANSASSNQNAIVLSGENGMTSIIGGTLLGNGGTGDVGVYCTGSSVGLRLSGLIIRQSHQPVEINGCSNVVMEPQIFGPTIGSANGAVYVTGTNSRLTIRPFVTGGGGVFNYGINLSGTGTTGSTVDPSAIDPQALQSNSAAFKVYYNGGSISTAGSFGTNNWLMGNPN